MARHERLYLRLLREWALLDKYPHRYEWARVRKTRVGCLVLKLERSVYVYR